MNFGVNRGILIAGMVIVGTTLLSQVWVQGNSKNVTKILVGGYVFTFIVAVIDFIPGVQNVTTALAMLAALVCVLLYGGGILGKFGNAVPGSQTPTAV